MTLDTDGTPQLEALSLLNHINGLQFEPNVLGIFFLNWLGSSFSNATQIITIIVSVAGLMNYV